MTIASSGKFTAVGAIVIGCHQEHRVRIDRLTVKRQVFNAFSLRIYRLAFAVIFRGLRHINLIIHAVDHVEVIGAETVPVNQRLRFTAVNVDLVKLTGRTLQPLFHLFARRFHHHQRVRVEIKIRRVAEGELAFFHFDIACRVVLAPTHFERGRSRQDRQFCEVWIALNKALDVGFLRHVDDLHRRIVLHQRQEAVHIVGGFPDRLADKFAGRVVIVFQYVQNVFIFCCQRFFGCRVVNRTRFGFRLRDLPFPAVVVQHQIHHAQMIAPHARHHRRYAVQRAFLDIRALDAGEIFAWEHRVRVAKQNGVDARHFTEIVNGVLGHRLIRIGRQTGVCDHHHQIGAFLTHFRHVFARRFGDVVDGHFAGEIRFVPGHDLRRHKTDIADFKRLLFTVLIDHLSLFNQIWRKQRLLRLNVDDIGINVREFCPGKGHVEIIQAVVKFMISKVADGVIQGIQRLVDRVDITLFQPFRRHVVAERTTLN
ncbi:hypothetical protein D3C71_663090 [compost metagenome]